MGPLVAQAIDRNWTTTWKMLAVGKGGQQISGSQLSTDKNLWETSGELDSGENLSEAAQREDKSGMLGTPEPHTEGTAFQLPWSPKVPCVTRGHLVWWGETRLCGAKGLPSPCNCELWLRLGTVKTQSPQNNMPEKQNTPNSRSTSPAP